MRFYVLAVLFLLIALVSVQAAGQIISPYSILYPQGGNVYTQTIFNQPMFVVNSTGQWAYYTSTLNWTQLPQGEQINWTYNNTNFTVTVLNIAPTIPWKVIDNGGSLHLWFNVTVPQTVSGTFTTFFPASWLPYWDGVNSTGFCGKGICISFPDYNRQDNGTFNSTMAIYPNATGNLIVQVNYSCSLAAGCPETFDPQVSNGASDSVAIYSSSDISQTAINYLKFLTSVIPSGATIQDAELSMLFSRTVGVSVNAQYNISFYNGTVDWNASNGNATYVNSLPYNYTGNYTTVVRNGLGNQVPPLYWQWNVTPSFAYAFLNGSNSSYAFSTLAIKPITIGLPTFRFSTLLSFGGVNSLGIDAYQFNSTTASSFLPMLNVTYDFNQAPLYSNPVLNSTQEGTPALFSLNWSSLNGLQNYTIAWDNGSGQFQNFTGTFTGFYNQSNLTFFIPYISGNTMRFIVWAEDNQTLMNSTGIFSYTLTGAYGQCPNGDMIVGDSGIINLYAYQIAQGANGFGLGVGSTCNALIFFDNNTNFSLATGSILTAPPLSSLNQTNVTFDPQVAAQYLVAWNCSSVNGKVGYGAEYTFKAVSLCTGPLFINSGSDMSFPLVDFTLIAFLTVIALALFIAGYFAKTYYMLLGAAFLLVIASFFWFLPQAGYSFGVLNNSTTAISFASGGLTGTLTTTPSYTYPTNAYTMGLGLFYLVIGISLMYVSATKIATDTRTEENQE